MGCATSRVASVQQALPAAPVPARSSRGSRGSRGNSSGTSSSRDSGLGPATGAGEAGAGVALLRVVHTAFPLSSVWDCRRGLLGSGQGRPRINGRTFKLDTEQGKLALGAFLGALRAAPLPTADDVVPSTVTRIDFAGEYTSESAEMVEMDCLLMVPSPELASWALATDGAQGEGSTALFYIEAPELRALDAAARAGLPLIPPLPAQRAQCGAFSAQHYPSGANMYVLGEVYSPQNRAEGLLGSTQKLLQMERELQVLCAREGGLPVAQCVLGVVLIGPHMRADLGAAMARTLSYYRQRLPCLWDLQQRRRFLGLRQQDFFPEVAAVQVQEELRALSTSVGAMEVRLGNVEATMHALNDKFDQVLKLLALPTQQRQLGGAAAQPGP